LEYRLGNRTGNAGILRFGTRNIRTLYNPVSLQCVLKEISHVDIVGLQEIRWPGSGNLKSENITVFFSGKKNGKHDNGVGFKIKASMSKLVKKFDAIQDRICYIVLTGKIFDTVIVNCYASTETADCELKDQFYDDLDRVFDNLPRVSIKIVVGDFNAQVGRKNIFKPIVGKEILHQESNNNGMRLISLCTDKWLVISSTQFQRNDIYIYKHTWIAPDGQ